MSSGCAFHIFTDGVEVRCEFVAQICAKIGGIPWAVSELPFFDKRTMVCGLDAYHDGEDGLLSVLGFVASYNRTCTKYWSSSQMT